jgi:hypothetical protein
LIHEPISIDRRYSTDREARLAIDKRPELPQMVRGRRILG